VNRVIAICTVIAWSAAWLVIVVAQPWVLSDSNKFLQGFLDHEFLGFMGVVVTITLASSANLFIELNKLEEKFDFAAFPNTKRDVKTSAFTLIGTLIASVFIAIAKPLVISGERSQAIVNGIAVTLIIFSVLILIDLTQSAFNLEPGLRGPSDPPSTPPTA
jgi:hypothetical protein